MNPAYSKQVQCVLDILRDEINGDIDAALKKMAHDYTMTWMYANKQKGLFPTTDENIQEEMQKAYPIRGRQYDVRNIAEGESLVMVELIESYPDPKSGRIYRTPLVLVLEMQGNKIRTGRHYCDPAVSEMFLAEEDIDRAFKKRKDSKLNLK